MSRLVLVLALLTLASCGDEGAPDAAGGGGRETRTSTKPKMDKAAYERLQNTEVPGFTGQPGYLGTMRGVVHYVADERTPEGGTLKAMVALEPAGMVGWMDPDVYEGKEALFLQGIDSKHRDDPDLVWSYGALDLGGGRRGIAQYVRSYVPTSADGKTIGGRLLSYVARYHDGTNGITISIFVHDVEAKSTEALAKILPKERGDEVARTIFAAFADAFD